ncbi:arylsulfatase [bacterium]|nr:arylsulfatase [bacterium]
MLTTHHSPLTTALTRRSFLAGAGALALSLGRGASAQEPRKPNLLVILADDMGYSDPGCYGGEIQTPNLDGLAAKGIRFTQVYSTGRCWPSRSCIMTGFYAQQIRMDPPRGKLPAWTRLAPHYLKPAGYRCYHSGKWHIRGANKPCADGGFDRSYRLADHDRFFSPKNHQEDDKPLPPIKPDSGFYTTTAIADHSIRCLKDHAAAHKDKPFFQYLAFNCPHFPLHALQKDIDRYRDTYTVGWDAVRKARHARMRKMGIINCKLSALQPKVKPSWNLKEAALKERIGPGEAGHAVPWDTLDADQKKLQATKMAIHAAMVDRMDQEIGRVLKQIEDMGQLDDTVVIFISDNGASAEQIIRGDKHDKTAPPGSWRSYLCLGPGFSTAANTPFRYHKSWNHEGGIASPCIVHWPAGLEAKGELRHNPGHFIDILPTLLDVAGVRPPNTWKGKPAPPMQGRSLAPAFAKDGSVPQPFLYFHHGGNRAIRVGDWKLAAAGGKGPWELYNLATDRCEMNNLAAKQPVKAKELADTWKGHEDAFRKMAKSDTWPGDG